jgi:hypothetical protein
MPDCTGRAWVLTVKIAKEAHEQDRFDKDEQDL